MGIPRLTSYLEPYSVPGLLGCDSFACPIHNPQIHSSCIIIDGPGLAYHIFYRILAHKPASWNAIDAMPTYQEIGELTVLYLQELEKRGVCLYEIERRRIQRVG